jgi:ribosome biogenesis protein ERB1
VKFVKKSRLRNDLEKLAKPRKKHLAPDQTMAASRKRKAVTRDIEADAAVVSGTEPEYERLDGALSDDSDDALSSLSDDGSEQSVALSADDDDDLSNASDTLLKPKTNGSASQSVQQNGDNESSEEEPNFTIEKDAYGNDRYVYGEIDPGDDSEYSVPDAEANTIGDIPLKYYDSYPHIGYNINGKKIMRPATGEALDALLDSIEVPKGWTGLTDPNTGKPLRLNQEELQLLKKVQMNELATDGIDPYEPTVEWFTSKVEQMPLSAAPEPKRRFVPSKHEQKRVMKIVRAIREGRILPYKPPSDEEEDEGLQNYDVWADEEPRKEHAMHMPAPKLPPPGFDESYHPPPEYLPDTTEKKEWESTDPEDRDKDYLPTDHAALRKVPGWGNFVKEKFERCLDLYLAPRVRRTKLNIDPESLLPKLPDPDELRPFPMRESERYVGHEGRVRSVAVSPAGDYLATGGDDGTVRVWTLTPAREIWSVKLDSDEAVHTVRWRPGKDASVLAVAVGDEIYLCAPSLEDVEDERTVAGQAILDAGWGFATAGTGAKAASAVAWARPSSKLQQKGVAIVIGLGHAAKTISFHAGGNYFVSVCPGTNVPASQAIAVHTLNKHQTQLPFRKRVRGGGTPQVAHFHPTRPVLYVANQRLIRAYDLSKQSLLKIIQPGARWISSFDVHPTSASTAGSDNLIVGSYDRRLLWMDLELSPRPYKTLRFHEKAIRAVRFHPAAHRYPLFADGSDDGSIQVFHGSVTSDMMSNAQIVPLKVLRGHKVSGGLGVMDLDWHPSHPWLVSAGGDGTCRLWVS